MTDVAGPSAPIITNLTCHDEQSIYLEWEKPSQVYNNLDSYYVLFRSADQWEHFEEVAVTRDNETAEEGMERVRADAFKVFFLHSQISLTGCREGTAVWKGDRYSQQLEGRLFDFLAGRPADRVIYLWEQLGDQIKEVVRS